MPVPTFPGVYVEEVPSGVRTITGVATSITAFVGRARRGPVNHPVTVNNFADFERAFGGLWSESTMSYAVRDFYLNGGSAAVIVRLLNPTEDGTEPGHAGGRRPFSGSETRRIVGPRAESRRPCSGRAVGRRDCRRSGGSTGSNFQSHRRGSLDGRARGLQ